MTMSLDRKAGSDPSSVSFSIDGIDVEKGLSRMRGKQDRYLKILSIFYKEGLEKIDQIDACMANEDIGLYTTHVHALKSASANVGADKLSKDSEILESAGNRKDWDYISKHNAEFMLQYKKILENINAVLESTVPSGRDVPIDAEKLSETLRELKQAFNDYDSGAINKGINALKYYSEAVGIGQHIENILNNKRRGEFEAAASAIDECLVALKARADL